MVGSIREAEAAKNSIKRDLDALREYSEYLKRRSDLERRIGIEEEKLKRLETELRRLREDVSKLRGYELRLEEVEAEVRKLDGPPTEPESLAHAIARRDEISAVVSSLKDLRGALQGRTELIEHISALEADLAKKSDELAGIRSRIAELQSELQRLRRRLSNLRERRDALGARAAALTRVSQGLFGLGAAVLFLSFLAPAVSHALAGVPLAIALAVWYYASKPREEYRRLEGMVPALEEQERKVAKQLEEAQRQEIAASKEMVDLREKIEERRKKLEEVARRVRSLLERLRSRGIDLPEEIAGPEDVDPTLSVWEERLKEANAEVGRREERKKGLMKEANQLRGEIERA